jgi:two-component system response regulator VicR
MSKRVLIVEDDAALSRVLQDNFRYEGFTVECAADGPDALKKAASYEPDLVLLDLMLPGLSGFEVCQTLSGHPARPAIIIITSRNKKDDKVLGLELGADDYVTKPFEFDELLARAHAVLRRSHPKMERLVLGDVIVDFRNFRATRRGEALNLQHREIELLRHLAERPGRTVSREDLLRLVWGYREVPLTRTVDICVARLRRKIEADPHHHRFLRTAHGDGYCLALE